VSLYGTVTRLAPAGRHPLKPSHQFHTFMKKKSALTSSTGVSTPHTGTSTRTTGTLPGAHSRSSSKLSRCSFQVRGPCGKPTTMLTCMIRAAAVAPFLTTYFILIASEAVLPWKSTRTPISPGGALSHASTA